MPPLCQPATSDSRPYWLESNLHIKDRHAVSDYYPRFNYTAPALLDSQRQALKALNTIIRRDSFIGHMREHLSEQTVDIAVTGIN